MKPGGTVNRAIIKTGRWKMSIGPDMCRPLWRRRIDMLFPNRTKGPREFTLEVALDDVRTQVANIDIKKHTARQAVMEMVQKWMEEVDLK